MFKIGDLIIYGSEGVCRVEDIGVPDMFEGETTRQYYTLNPLYKQGLVYTPIDTKVFMRPIISREEALNLIHIIPEIDDEVFENRNIRVLSEKYQQTMSSHKCIDLLRVVKSVHHKRKIMDSRGKKLGQVDEKFYKKAKDLLHEEFSVVFEIPKDDVESFISDSMNDFLKQAN